MKTCIAMLVALTATLTFGAANARAADPAPAQVSERDAFVNAYRASVAIVVEEDMQGKRRQICTATAFERTGDTYRFATAAHCVASDDEEHERVKVNKEEGRWWLTFDDANGDTQSYYRVKVVAVGYQHRQDDFAVLEATIKGRNVPVMTFAAKPAHRLEEVINIAAPQGLGKQDFTGHVTNENLDRPIKTESGINWEHAIMLQIQAAGGSSGSAVVSLEQKGIIAFLVGIVGGTNVIAIPASRFQNFWKLSSDGRYRWFHPASDNDEQDDCFCKMNPDGTKDLSSCFCRDLAPRKPAKSEKH